MPDIEISLKVYARDMHAALQKAALDADGRTGDSLEEWQNKRQPQIAHEAGATYLIGCLSFLEGNFGKVSWNKLVNGKTFDEYLSERERDDHKAKIKKFSLSSELGDALQCIRNAVTHNSNDLSKNDDKASFSKVSKIKNMHGLELSGQIVSLKCDKTQNFMSTVKLFTVFMYYFHNEMDV